MSLNQQRKEAAYACVCVGLSPYGLIIFFSIFSLSFMSVGVGFTVALVNDGDGGGGLGRAG